MTDRDSRSSENRIREARERLRGGQTDSSEAETLPADPVLEPDPIIVTYEPVEGVAEGHEPVETPTSQPRQGGGFWSSLVVRLAIGFLIFGGWWLFTSFDDANRDGSGEIVGGGDLDVMTMQPGDCFNDPDGDVVFDVQAVPCSESHDNEVFSVGTLGGAFGENFPGLESLDAYAYDTCVGSPFESFVGTPYLESSLGVFTLTPTEESWEDGDRGYVCALYSFDFAPLTGTARDSGL